MFPFDSDLSTKQIAAHLHEVAAGYSPFRIKLQSITGSKGQFLFLNVKQGNDDIISLHDKLYSGLLAPILNRQLTYIPHMTVGRLSDRQTFLDALSATSKVLDVFETSITEIVSEIIDPDGKSTMELKLPLGTQAL